MSFKKLPLQLMYDCYWKCCIIVTESAVWLLPKRCWYSGDTHPVIPAICTHLLNYHFDKITSFLSNSLHF